MARHVKKNDTVEIIAGDDKGAIGRVLRVIPEKNLVVIQGLNIAKKHVRPSRKNPQGGRINVERPLHMSNVLPVNTKTSKGERVSYKIGKDGRKKRVFKSGGEI